MKKDELINIIKLTINQNNNYSNILVSLIINDFLGGIILKNINKDYYYNFCDEDIIDFFNKNYLNDESVIIDREEILYDEEIKNIYLIFLKELKENFVKYGNKEYKLIDENGNMFLSKVPGTIGGNKKLKIYGKLDCVNAINWLNKGFYKYNRVFFENENVAKKNGYRPCAKCMKKEYLEWKYKM